MHFILLLLVFCLGLFYLRYFERRTIFYPTRVIEFLPSQFNLDYEEAYFQTADKVRLHGWFIPVKGAALTVIFCHGNAGNISHRIEKLNFFKQLGLNIFIFDYRGYGKSQGYPTEEGLYLDVKAAYDYLLSRKIDPGKIIGYGESLGGAVIIDLAAQEKVGLLMIEGTFSNAKDMARQVFPFIPSWLFSSKFDSAAKIKSITVPKLIIHSLNDEIVPYGLAERLYVQAAGPKEFLKIHGAHNSCFYESEVILKEGIAGFLSKYFKP